MMHFYALYTCIIRKYMIKMLFVPGLIKSVDPIDLNCAVKYRKTALEMYLIGTLRRINVIEWQS